MRDIASLGKLHSNVRLDLVLISRRPGLKTVVSEITPGTPLAATACAKLAPKVIAQVESVSSFVHVAVVLILKLDIMRSPRRRLSS